MPAPTEAEIRAAIEPEWPEEPAGDPPEWIYEALMPIVDSDQALIRAGWVEGFHPQRPHPGTLWADMRQDEADELHGAINTVIDEAAREYQRAVLDGVVAATIRFAERHPDIPRGRWPIEPDDDAPETIVEGAARVLARS